MCAIQAAKAACTQNRLIHFIARTFAQNCNRKYKAISMSQQSKFLSVLAFANVFFLCFCPVRTLFHLLITTCRKNSSHSAAVPLLCCAIELKLFRSFFVYITIFNFRHKPFAKKNKRNSMCKQAFCLLVSITNLRLVSQLQVTTVVFLYFICFENIYR